MKKIFLLISCLIFLISLGELTFADVYMGTSEGYVYNTEGQLVANAFVNATVDRCEVQCSRDTTTDAGGYYVAANLNLPKLEGLIVYAQKMTPLGLEFGSARGIANEFQAARVDVIICLPPPLPTLVNEPNTHDTFAGLEWTSYDDKKAYDTYDEFQIDSRNIVRSDESGVKYTDISGLSFSSHAWRVRTCNPFCCSAWSSDNFNVGNSRPLPPNLTNQLDTISGTVSLNWTSGPDPDNDITYDEYCVGLIDTNYLSTTYNCRNATAPKIENVVGCNYYNWRVRTCENESEHLCSMWGEDGFIVCGFECPACTSGGGGGGGGGGGAVSVCEADQPYSLTLNYQPVIEETVPLTLSVGFTTARKISGIIFKVNSSDFYFSDYKINELNGGIKAEFKMTGMPKETTLEGTYNLNLDAFVGNKLVISEPFSVEVKEVSLPLPAISNPLIRLIFNKPPKRSYFWILVIVLIIIISAISLAIIKIVQQRKKQRSNVTRIQKI